MIGKAYKALTSYYDKVTRSMQFKSRPCLVIGASDSSDYVVLPISKVTDRRKIDPDYDIPLDNSVFTFLDNSSYLRTHKQMTVNVRNLRGPICDFKASYEDAYLDALIKVQEFQERLLERAI